MFVIPDELVQVAVAERTPRRVPHYLAPPRRRSNGREAQRGTLTSMTRQLLRGLRSGLAGGPDAPAPLHTLTR